MRIGLIDIDYNGSFPNIPLMKISAYHKAKGDEVEFYIPFGDRYDIVYISKVFSWSEDYKDAINANKIIRGGTGYAIQNKDGREYFGGSDLSLPDEIEHIYPDYSLYPKLCNDTAYGFLSRGCPRGCSFCHVAAKEGKRSVKVANLSEFWHGQKNIVLCDPNILACKDWRDLLQQLIDSRSAVDINQGLDIRLMTEEKAQMLSRIKLNRVHFAWDKYEDKDAVVSKLEMFTRLYYADKNQNHNAVVYVLVNYNTTIEQDLDRIYTLRDLGYWAYVMIYDKEHASKQHRNLARWCNNRIIFAKCERFEDYLNE